MHFSLKDIVEVLVFGVVFGALAIAGTWWDRKHRKP